MSTTQQPAASRSAVPGHPSRAAVGRPARALRTPVWVLLVLSAVANAMGSVVGVSVAVQATLSLTTGLCIAALVVGHLRRRR